MLKATLGVHFPKNFLVLLTLFTTVLLVLSWPEIASATVESSIKGVGASFQKLALGCGVFGFTLGGLGMMFGASEGCEPSLAKFRG